MRTGEADHVQSLERGLSVIRAFDADHPRLTLSEAAARTGLTRAAARRYLLTLQAMGYVRSDDREFSLCPRVLELGYAYLSTLTIPQIAAPYLEELARTLQTASSISVLDGTDIVYIARAETRRIMSVNIAVGTRFPAVYTSMGRAMLALLGEEDLDRFLAQVTLRAFTERSITDMGHLRAELARIGQLGYALLDQELELGVRSVAVALTQADGRPMAAVNVSVPAFAQTPQEMLDTLLTPLRKHAHDIETNIRGVTPVRLSLRPAGSVGQSWP